MSESLQRSNNDNIRNGQSLFQFIPNQAFQNEGADDGNGLVPRKIIALLLRYKWIVLAFLIAGGTAAWFYAESLTPIYESSGTLMISPSDATQNEELSQIISQATGYGTSTTLANELQVLKSRKFSRQVAANLIDEEPGNINEFPILWTVEEESGEVSRSNEEQVASRIRSNLSFKQLKEESDVIEVSFQSPSPQEAAKVVNEALEMYVKNSTQQNRQAANATAEFLEEEKEEIKRKLRAAEDRLRRYMDSTGIVQVDEQASGMVDQRAETEAELQRINLELQTIEQTISNYEKQLERIKPGLSDQFSEAIGPRIRNAQETLAEYEREKTLIISKNPGVLERDPIPPRLKYINDQIAKLKQEIKDLSSQLFTSDNEFMGLDGEDRAQIVADIQSKLVELRIERNQYSSRRDALRQHKQEMDSSFNALPEGMIELAKLQRDVRINEELYMNVSRQYADMAVLKQSQFGFGRIIDKGDVPGGPVSPNKKILLLLGLMLGGFVSAGFIAIKEFMDDSVNSAEQLRTMYHPALTLSPIPTIEKISKGYQKSFKVGNGNIPKELVMLHDRLNIVSESIRRLKNNIIYQHGDAPPKTVAVTSPEKGDGKTTVVSNLGIAFAEEGYKTLIVDTDFRRPMLHNYFGLKGKAGLTDYLNGKITIQHLIQNTDVNTLKVITAGRRPAQRPEIMVSDKALTQFLKKMEDIFDVILLDTPPFGIISDSTPLLKMADTTLVVARYRKTNQGILLRTLEELDRIHANINSIVLNDFDYRKETGHYYGSGYYKSLYENYDAYLS